MVACNPAPKSSVASKRYACTPGFSLNPIGLNASVYLDPLIQCNSGLGDAIGGSRQAV